MLSSHNNYSRVIRVETHKSFLWHVQYRLHTATHTHTDTHTHTSQKPRPGRHTNTVSDTHWDNTLCGGSNYVKWLVLITFLCLRGDYEHINQQHACQLEVSKPGKTSNEGKWVEKNTRVNKVFFFFFFSVTWKKVNATMGGNSKDSDECTRVQLFKYSFFILSSPHQPPVALDNTCVWTLTHQDAAYLLQTYRKHPNM